MTAGPNILLVVFDTARADVFEPYGAPPGASPAVAQLADTGTAVPLAYAPACWTVPSHVSLFTGLLPRSAGADHSGGGDPAHFRAVMEHHEARLVPSVLRRAGWTTSGVSANQWIHERSGFDLGFDTFTSVRSERVKAFERQGRRAQVHWYLDALAARLDDGATRIESMLDEWRRSESRPFFWFVNLVECHSPYLPPRPHTTLGPLGRLLAARDAKAHLNFESIWMSNVGGFSVPADAIDRMRRQYAASIAQLDAWLARVLDGLDRAGVLDDTQVIVTSDHGENLGENDLLGHAFSLDDRLLRVPLVTGGPLDLDPGRAVSLVELPAQLGDALGLDHPWEPPTWRGTPVAQFDAPGTRDNPRLYEAIEKWGLGADAVERMCTSFTCATDGRFKLFRRAGRDELVDLRADPLETVPRAVEGTETAVAALRRALDLAEADERPALATGPPPPTVDDDETKRIEEQMRLLGYL